MRSKSEKFTFLIATKIYHNILRTRTNVGIQLLCWIFKVGMNTQIEVKFNIPNGFL